MKRPLLFVLPLLAAASCGEDLGGDVVDVDPAFFDSMVFDCDPETEAPECPPFSCAVDGNGTVVSCESGCQLDPSSSFHRLAFEFQGPEGVDLCAPRECFVAERNEPPVCTTDCAEDDVTSFTFDKPCE